MVWPDPAVVPVVDSGCVRIAHPVTGQRFGILEGLRRVVQIPFEHGTDENAGHGWKRKVRATSVEEIDCALFLRPLRIRRNKLFQAGNE